MKKEIFTSMSLLSKAKGISLDELRACRELNCDGTKPNGRWYWEDFSKWYEQNKNAVKEYLLEQAKEDNNGEWKQRKERAQALIAEIQLKELEGKTLDKDKVAGRIKAIASAQSIMLRNTSQELPHKLLGKNLTDMQVILTKSYEDICNLFQSAIEDWTQQSKETKHDGTKNDR